jgi:hypothetical protein
LCKSRKHMKSLHHSPKGPSQLRLNWGVATRYSRGKRSGLWLPIDSISRICKGWECHWLLDPLRFHPFILKNAKRTVWVYHCGERKKEDVGFTWISSMSSTQPAQSFDHRIIAWGWVTSDVQVDYGNAIGSNIPKICHKWVLYTTKMLVLYYLYSYYSILS